MAHILVLDDDADIRALIATALERDGHQICSLEDGSMLTDAHCRWADCLLLDVMMPGEDGFSICRRIRSLLDCPILFLTAKTQEADILTGLGIGGDDYLCKPFRLSELRARVNAHLRRQQRTSCNRMLRGSYVFDLSSKEVFYQEQPVRLTKSEYAICEYLALHSGQTLSKEQIYEAVFGLDGTADNSAITEHIKNIRSKLKAADPTVIKTVWGEGYRWDD